MPPAFGVVRTAELCGGGADRRRRQPANPASSGGPHRQKPVPKFASARGRADTDRTAVSPSPASSLWSPPSRWSTSDCSTGSTGVARLPDVRRLGRGRARAGDGRRHHQHPERNAGPTRGPTTPDIHGRGDLLRVDDALPGRGIGAMAASHPAGPRHRGSLAGCWLVRFAVLLIGKSPTTARPTDPSASSLPC